MLLLLFVALSSQLFKSIVGSDNQCCCRMIGTQAAWGVDIWLTENVYEVGEGGCICCTRYHGQRQCSQMFIFLPIAATGIRATPKLVPSVYPAGEIVP